MIFHWTVLDLYAYDLHKNAEKPGVISFLSQIFCQKAVLVSVDHAQRSIAYILYSLSIREGRWTSSWNISGEVKENHRWNWNNRWTASGMCRWILVPVLSPARPHRHRRKMARNGNSCPSNLPRRDKGGRTWICLWLKTAPPRLPPGRTHWHPLMTRNQVID